jgi:hypothetical protein
MKKIAGAEGAAKPLKSPDSDEGIQGNPRKSKAPIQPKDRRIWWNPRESKADKLDAKLLKEPAVRR